MTRRARGVNDRRPRRPRRSLSAQFLDLPQRNRAAVGERDRREVECLEHAAHLATGAHDDAAVHQAEMPAIARFVLRDLVARDRDQRTVELHGEIEQECAAIVRAAGGEAQRRRECGDLGGDALAVDVDADADVVAALGDLVICAVVVARQSSRCKTGGPAVQAPHSLTCRLGTLGGLRCG